MKREEIEAHAKIIAENLNDLDGLGLHCKAIFLLGFQTCFELSSHALDMKRRGKLSRSAAAYFNGCVMEEVRRRGLEWNTASYDKR